MKRPGSLLTFLLIIALISAAFIYLKASDSDKPQAMQPAEASFRADYSLVSPHFVEMKGNDKQMDIKADSASYFKDRDMAELERPKAIFFGADGRPTHISGEHGIIDTSTNDLTLMGGVDVLSPEGHNFKTESLRYLSESKLVLGDDPVTIKGRNFLIKGVGMEFDMENDTYRINKDIIAFFNISGSELK